MTRRWSGAPSKRSEARGKWCLIFFSGDLILVTHMLMSGTWHIYRTGEKWWQPKNRMRVAITCGDYQAVAFNVPIAEFHTARSLERNSQVPRLGPDVLADEFSVEAGVEALRQRAASHPTDEIAVVLLNQRVLAGLGNVTRASRICCRRKPFPSDEHHHGTRDVRDGRSFAQIYEGECARWLWRRHRHLHRQPPNNSLHGHE